MKIYLLLPILFIFHSCTYSITMVHTEGTATDVVDETATNTPNVSPTITLPIVPGV
jgi:hypothetical protein